MRGGYRGRYWVGFSLIEILVVVVVLGIIAATTLPRLSRGAAGAAETQVSGSLAVMRNALELYQREHGGKYPAAEKFEAQMTQYTSFSGEPRVARDEVHCFGPYLRKVPALSVGGAEFRNSTLIVDLRKHESGSVAGAWAYEAATGEIRANVGDALVDADGERFNQY